MKAGVVHSFDKPLVIEDIPKPTPGPGEIVVKIECSGLCHTDIHAAHGDWPDASTKTRQNQGCHQEEKQAARVLVQTVERLGIVPRSLRLAPKWLS